MEKNKQKLEMWDRAVKKITSAVKHKPTWNYRSGWPN